MATKKDNPQNSERVGKGNPPKEHRFKPGQSGNPGGRPKKRLIDEILAELLEAKGSAEAKKIAKALIKKAASGDSIASKLIAERTQGKPTQKVEVTGADGGPVEANLTVKFV